MPLFAGAVVIWWFCQICQVTFFSNRQLGQLPFILTVSCVYTTPSHCLQGDSRHGWCPDFRPISHPLLVQFAAPDYHWGESTGVLISKMVAVGAWEEAGGFARCLRQINLFTLFCPSLIFNVNTPSSDLHTFNLSIMVGFRSSSLCASLDSVQSALYSIACMYQ